jgi:putative ATP-binding cassette transporter
LAAFCFDCAWRLRAADPAIRASAARADAAERAFCALATHALDGFKELRPDANKMNDLVGRSALVAALEVLHERVRAGTQYSLRLVSIHVLRFVTIGAIIFVLPEFGIEVGGTVALVVVAFSFQYLLELIAYQPILSNCGVSIEKLRSLEMELKRFREPARLDGETAIHKFSTIVFENVSFSYTDRSGTEVFSVGPWNLTLAANRVVFVAGGDGSGKSTLLKLLTGL